MKFKYVLLLSSVLFCGSLFASCSEDDIEQGYDLGIGDNDSGETDDETIGTTETLQLYDYPDVIVEAGKLGHLRRSEKFTVSVTQDEEEHDVYVMQDYNTLKAEGTNNQAKNFMTTYNHSANFSFKNSVQIKVSRKDGGSMSDAVVYPKEKKYQYSVSGNDLIITLNSWAYVYVQVPDLKDDPLFIFADPIENNIPAPASCEVLDASMDISDIRTKITSTSKKTIYFKPGIYSFGSQTNNTYPGYKIPIVSDKNYYIPGGVVIIGSFYGESGISNTKFYGRGIITTCGKERIPNSDGIPFNLYYAGNGENNVIEGLHFNNPAHFCVLSRGQLTTQYTKMFGWWHQTDGWGGGDNSTIKDCFIKVNDDFIKIYAANQTADNIVMYKQINGAGIQLGWNAAGQASNCRITNIYVVNEDDKKPASLTNTAVIDLVNNEGSIITDITFRDFYLENMVQMFLCLNNNNGKLNNFIFENIYEQQGANNENNYIVTKKEAQGTYSNFTFINYFIKDKQVLSEKNMNLIQGYDLGDNKVENVRLFTPIFR